jgi:hypothetical protein
MSHCRSRAGWSVIVGAALLGLTPLGCARSLALGAAEIDAIRAEDPELTRVRVYVSRKIVAALPPTTATRSYEVRGPVIRERREARPTHVVVGRRVAGAIVGETEAADRPVLWVSFDPSCEDAGCSFGFVLHETGEYLLFAAPSAEGGATTAYERRARPAKALSAARIVSLADANAVLARTRRGVARTIALMIRKSTRAEERARVERARGHGGGR